LGLDLPRVALDPCSGDGALRRCLALDAPDMLAGKAIAVEK
jgi:hypothetical protein